MICHPNNWAPHAIKNIYDQGWCTADRVRLPRKRMWEICSWPYKFNVLVLFRFFTLFIFVPCFPDKIKPTSKEGKKINFSVFLVRWRWWTSPHTLSQLQYRLWWGIQTIKVIRCAANYTLQGDKTSDLNLGKTQTNADSNVTNQYFRLRFNRTLKILRASNFLQSLTEVVYFNAW